jgi:hypothetical protein
MAIFIEMLRVLTTRLRKCEVSDLIALASGPAALGSRSGKGESIATVPSAIDSARLPTSAISRAPRAVTISIMNSPPGLRNALHWQLNLFFAKSQLADNGITCDRSG